MHLTITPTGVTADGTPLQAVEGTLRIHAPNRDGPVRVTVDLLPPTLTLTNTNTFDPRDIPFIPKEEWDKAIKSVSSPCTSATLRAR